MLLKFKKSLFFILIAISFVNCQQQEKAQPAWPEITNQTKPWTRWWWHGSAVTEEGITAELEAYKKAGLGGVEITPIYGVEGKEKEFIDFLSSKWTEMLIYTLREADRLGLGVDMATGTGWPFGGPWVNEDDACKNMVHRTWQLAGGQQLNESVAYYQEPFVRAIGNNIFDPNAKRTPPSEIAVQDLKDPISSNKNLQALAIDQVRFKRHLPLQVLMAYSDNNEKIHLTEKVDAGGKLNWTAPEGRWTLYAVYMGWHGKMVERAAPGGEGNVIDHFNVQALNNYLAKFDSAFSGKNISSLRAFFNDSYEVDDARGSADYTPHLFEEFRKRQGYDLREYLPALFGDDSEEKNKRVLSDYRETISELILENFTKAWVAWSHQKDALVRNQAHGSPSNILDLYEAVDIPEMEGEDFLRIKMASSAANVSGKPLSSSESATWLNEHFLSNLSDIKKSLDRFMLSGINHVFYHGTTYSPPEEPWPGRLFYAAVHANPRNPMWDDFAKLNTYGARCQSFLQNSTPDNDVQLYYPIYDRFAAAGNEMIEHFDGPEERQFGGTAFKEAAETMLEKGFGFDFISDKQIQKLNTTGGKLVTGGNEYQTIVIPQCEFIPLKTFEKLVALAKEGATVVAFKGLPKDVPGMNNLEERQNKFRQLLTQIDSSATTTQGVSETSLGQGKFLVGDDLEELLTETTARKETLTEHGLQFIRKQNENGPVYFIANWNDSRHEGWITLNTIAKHACLFNPMTGAIGKASTQESPGGQLQIYLQLEPLETIIVEACAVEAKGDAYPIYELKETPAQIEGEWTVEFVSGGPLLPEKITTSTLRSWTEFEGNGLESFSGTAIYTIEFDKPTGESATWLLDLGEVKETVEVSLNGNAIDTLIGPSFRTVIADSLLEERNTLTLKVSNLMANRIAYMDKEGKFWKKFYNVNVAARLPENRKNGIFDASGWAPTASGLLGSVTLQSLEEKHF